MTDTMIDLDPGPEPGYPDGPYDKDRWEAYYTEHSAWRCRRDRQLHCFAGYDQMLTGRTPTRRKLANNTYAERRDDDTIAVRLHDTDIVTYHRDGRITFDTGGWLTVTTKDRMNRYSPCHFWSTRGVWTISTETGAHEYRDGCTVHPDGTVTGVPTDDEIAERRKRNDATRKAINAFVSGITAEQIVHAFNNTGGDCFICRFGDTSCLAEHVEERYFHGHLAKNAVTARGYRNPDVILGMILHDAERGVVSRDLTDNLRKYLRKHLLEGVATR